MSAVYSTQFLLGAYTGAGSPTAYTVPAGKRAVVRCVDIVLAAGGPAVCGWVVPAIAQIGAKPVSATDPVYMWRGDAVFNAGDQFVPFTSAGTIFYMVSGFLLNLT